MKHFRNFVISLGVLLISGCAAVPRQVVDAMDVQQEEIKRVKEIYFNNLNNQLDAIAKYRIAIIDIYEEQYVAKYSKTLDMVTEGGKTELKETKPTGDKNADHINIGKLEDLQRFFRSERNKVRTDINIRREQIYKANQNFENIEQINTVVNDYLQSLSRLKNSQDKLAKAIKDHVEKLIPIPISFENIPDPSTIEDLVKSLKK